MNFVEAASGGQTVSCFPLITWTITVGNLFWLVNFL